MAVQNRLPWSHNDILRLMEIPILWRTALQAAEQCEPITWHTSSVGVPGYSKYCPPGSGALCEAACLMRHVAGARHKPNKPLALDADVS